LIAAANVAVPVVKQYISFTEANKSQNSNKLLHENAEFKTTF
jgi:hypothetical protein